MRRYNLRHEADDRWLVVDGMTMQPAALDGIPICGMQWAEACDMVDLMNTLDSIERAADRYAASFRRSA
ncbi:MULTISPECIES: hypothetical protein [Rhizobium]|jgi:hypothetical protein|uniref:Uncharacterized protein n=4 Tax=Rhizobium TaxID=379 RepID=A0A1L5NH30_9HYPH|nr:MULTISPECIES: hypothetical protein [Rhizobium]APO67236.1 hypothetical protein IE4872_CH01593 [Rhizobium gallicum]MBB4228500.1 hypothetical protein [Rhizobium mongolense]QPB21006.1 hypothetical protein ISN39_05825 [Rhizobium sp. 007]TVZ64365.1 hypothetical protein BCL32_4607 [Rhizobium mongolense USDA 1844]ULJ73766.1 hypothetical protein L2W42_09495 [Rhizobium gallicum]